MSFRTIDSKGEQLTCKFCHKPIWYKVSTDRVYEPDGQTLHVENCPNRRAFFKARAVEYAERRRQRRNGEL